MVQVQDDDIRLLGSWMLRKNLSITTPQMLGEDVLSRGGETLYGD